MKRRICATVFLSFCFACSADGQTGTFIDRQDPSDLRVVTYNVNWDSIFPDNDPNNHDWRNFERDDEFRRVISALNPDIMCLQEINANRDPQDVADIFDAELPLGGGQQWHAYIGYSNCIVSRYPLSMQTEDTIPAGQRQQAMALVDLPTQFATDLYLINEHYKCCGNADSQRQQQSDAVVNWMRDARTPGGFITLPQDTPIIVLGDLNIVEGPQPLDTVVCGDIQNEGTYGGDSPPDWDGTCMIDLHPVHNLVGPDDYTWRNDGSSFDPGRLDYIIFQDSQLTVTHHFILNTTLMSGSELSATGLQQNDVVLSPPGYFDHVPLVADFQFATVPIVPDGDVNLDTITDGRDILAFATLALGGPGGDPEQIAHADYNGNNNLDPGDIPGFVSDLLGL